MHNLLTLLSFFLVATLPSIAGAHPHAWISVRTTIILNDKGQATAIREHWLFDKAYSAYAAHDFSPHGKGGFNQADLVKLAEENVANLKEFNYFTVFEYPTGTRSRLGQAGEVNSFYETPVPSARKNVVMYALPKGMKPDTEDASVKQIAMEFTIPLAAPIDLAAHAAVYRIYDPTYYVDMSHVEHNPVAFVREKDGAPVKGCTAKVELPKVDQAMIFSAAAIDRNGTAPQDLGYTFSEKVTLSCSLSK